MKRQITPSPAAYREIQSGAASLAEIIRREFGPSVRTSLIFGSSAHGEIPADGLDIARELVLPNANENAGVGILRAAARQTAELAGDGSKITVLLAERIMQEGGKLLAAGFDPVALRRGLAKALPTAKESLEKLTVKEACRKDYLHAISLASGDENLGALVIEALDRVGADGNVTVKYAESDRSYICADGSFSLSSGFASKYMATDEFHQEAVLQNASVLVCASPLNSVNEILKVLNEASIQQQPLLILAPGFADEVIKSFNSNIAQGTIRLCSVVVPEIGAAAQAWLEDAAVYTGTHVYGGAVYPELKNVSLADCGTAAKVSVTRDRTELFLGGADTAALSSHLSHLKALRKLAKTIPEQERLHLRIANLNGHTARLCIGGCTALQQKRAISQARKALKTSVYIHHGLLPGGGKAYLLPIPSIRALAESLPSDERLGAELMIAALRAPAEAILNNTLGNASAKLIELEACADWESFDALRGEIVDCWQCGILDLTYTLLTALECGISAGAQALTIGAAVLGEVPHTPKAAVPDDLHLTPQDFR